ncbi:HCNGP-like protein-domain-containing protein [Choanephora cucurbitarum]|nr:HCNGP-like protein-domain-containing protein [Choanephora cucurbitarum]
MSLLTGLVNYSDDEGSSADEEQQQEQKHEIQDKAERPKPIPTEQPKPTPINDYKRRLIAALAPKPIDGIDNWGIPEEPTTLCDSDRAEQIAHFLSLRASGHRLNDHLQHNKAFRNPRIYTKLVEFAEVDEFGSNFDREDYDPSGFPKEMYIDGILETQKKIAEEKAAQQQNRASINFVSSQPIPPALTQQQSTAMAQAMATAAKVASRIAKPPSTDSLVMPSSSGDKRRSKWEDHRSAKR